MKQARHRAREFALQTLYQWLIAKKPIAEIEAYTKQLPGFKKADAAHFKALLHGVFSHKEALEMQLSCNLDRAIENVSPIEHAILLMGAYELGYHADIPYRVIINEAVKLSKTFGNVDGYKYINGVLDKLAKQLRHTEIQTLTPQSMQKK